MSIVLDYLKDHRIDFAMLDRPPAFTAREEAALLRLAPGEVAKTVVLLTRTGFAAAVIPASERLDVELARAATGDPQTRLASEAEIELHFPAFQLGAIPPIGGVTGTPIYVDQAIAGHDDVVFAAGMQTESVRIAVADLLDDPHVHVAPLCLRFDDDGRRVATGSA